VSTFVENSYPPQAERLYMRESETHFEEAAWVDLARALVPEAQRLRMQSHLESGCVSCNETYKTWRLVFETAGREALYSPPEDVVRSVKGVLPLVRKLGLLPQIAEAARMIFDSFREPLPAGIRGRGSSARHLLYETDDFSIDLRLEKEGKMRVALTGQVLPKRAGYDKTAETRVLILGSDGRLLGHRIATSFGEFQVELAAHDQLELYVQLPDTSIKRINVPGPV
jgi:hypothetical protein